jgi:GNAT superfamily N-acetyltransferase
VTPVAYRIGGPIDVDEMIALYRACSLGARRPVDDRDRMAAMFCNANLVVSARVDGVLAGVARSVSDFAYCTYLSDLAVHEAHQRRGIGLELIRRTREAGGRATVILLSAPAAVGYYPKIGFKPHPSAWWLREEDTLSANHPTPRP